MDRLTKYKTFLKSQTEGIVGDYNRKRNPELYLSMKRELDNLNKEDVKISKKLYKTFKRI